MGYDGLPLAPRLAALGYESAATFDASDEASAIKLIGWLEDRHIRQLPLDERGPLRAGDGAALCAYLEALDAPATLGTRLASQLEEREFGAFCAFLVNLAVDYAYTERGGASEENAAPALIPPWDPALGEICHLLGVPLCADAVTTLRSIVKTVRARPRQRPPAPAPAPAPALAPAPAPQQKQPAAATSGRKRPAPPPLAPLSGECFPLGFETGSPPLDDAARVLRMLHVRELRRLQDAINEAVSTLQEFTANPRTDARLGRVGH